MSKKTTLMAKLAGDGGATTRVIPASTGSLLAIAAGVVAMVGVTSLHKRRVAARQQQQQLGSHPPLAPHAVPETGGPGSLSAAQVHVGLVRLHVPRRWDDLVKNDIFLQKAIETVTEELIVYVVGRDKHEIVNYTGELYNLIWDLVCLQGKPELSIRIVGGFVGMPSWDELLLLPELNAVFGEDEMLNVQHMNAKRFERDGLFAVTYHPMAMHAKRYLRGDFRYFENEQTDLKPIDTVLLGGTFDHLHNGHKKLLSLAVGICARRLVIGITAPEMLVHKRHAELIEALDVRQRNVLAYVTFLKPLLQVEFAVLTDPYGPALDVPFPAAIVMSTETLLAAPKINSIRISNDLRPLLVYVCRRTDGSTLSSSYIRERIAAGRHRGA